MSGNVVPIGKADIYSSRREALIQAVATSFEKYVADTGQEPDAIVYFLGGVKQSSLVAWEMAGESEGAATSCLSLAVVHLMSEAAIGMQR